MGKSSRGQGRTRSWTFILYPESAPENWRTILDEIHIQWIESPLHEFDINSDGEAKKPHYHILMMFESVKDYEQIKEITDSLNCPIPQKCAGAKALVRYMAHLDNPEKHQYNVTEIIAHGGADLDELLRPTSSQRYQLIREMVDFVRENQISEYSLLVDYAVSERFDDWFPLLCDNSTMFINSYITSIRHKKRNGGEV